MTRNKGILIAVAAAVLAFVAGFGSQYVRAERLDAALSQTQRALLFEEIAVTFGAATIEAHAENYEDARRLASTAFTGLQADIGEVPPEARAELQDVLAQRDEVITLLSRADPTSATELAALFGRYRGAWSESGATPEPESAPREPGDTRSG